MSFRKKITSNEVPILEDNLKPEFVEGETTELLLDVTDNKGKVIGKRKIKKVVYKPIPVEDWEHRGIDCDLFSVCNMQKVGSLPSASSVPQITPSLDDISHVQDQIEDIDFEELEEEK